MHRKCYTVSSSPTSSSWRILHVERHVKLCSSTFYPHMPIGRVRIYRLLFEILFVCLFVRLRISLPRIKLDASNFARLFIGVQGKESSILGYFAPPEAPPEAQNRTNRRIARTMAAQAWTTRACARATRRIGMCGYTDVPEDGCTCPAIRSSAEMCTQIAIIFIYIYHRYLRVFGIRN